MTHTSFLTANMVFSVQQKYRVLVEGENVVLNIEGIERFGFFTRRFVEATDAGRASERAIGLVERELQSCMMLLNEPGNPPVISVSAIAQVSSFEGIDVPGTGFSFYRMASH